MWWIDLLVPSRGGGDRGTWRGYGILMSFAIRGSLRGRSWVLARVGWPPAGSGLGCAGCGLSFLRGDCRACEPVAQGGLGSGSVAVVVCGVGGLPRGAGCRPLGGLFWGGPPSWIVDGWVLGLSGGWCACLWAPGEPTGLVGGSLWLSGDGGAAPWAGVRALSGVYFPWP